METHPKNFIDLTGQKHYRLTFLRCVGKNANGNAVWRVRCDCGVEFDAVGVAVRGGRTRSCGCLRIEELVKRNNKRKSL